MRRAVLARLLGLLGVAAGCADPGGSGDLFSVTAVVTGTVRTSTGAPVAGAAVTARLAWLTEPGAGLPADSATRWTNAGGAYEVEVGTLNAPDQDVALALHVEPPAGSGLAPADTAGLRVRIARREPGRIRVDVTLRPPPE